MTSLPPATPGHPTTLHLMRHGLTRFNTERRIQGWSDSELTPEGVRGVEATAERLAGVEFTRAWSSTSPRALATASIVLDHHEGVELTTCDGLKEFNFGVFEAGPEADLLAHVDLVHMYSELMAGTFEGLPDGESAREYLGRVARTFLAIEAAATGDVLVVSHGVTLMTYLTLIGQRPTHSIANASIIEVGISSDGERTASFEPPHPGAPVRELNLPPTTLQIAAAFEATVHPR